MSFATITKDFVKNDLPIALAQQIIDHGETLKPEVDGYPININNKWHFEGVVVKTSKKKRSRDEEVLL
jgi:hypothetical protein